MCTEVVSFQQKGDNPMKEKTIKKNLTPAEMFDSDDLSDLPSEVLKQIREEKPPLKIDDYVQLLKIKSPLTVNQIIIGLYRAYGIKRSRSAHFQFLHHGVAKSLIKRVKGKRGLYEICQE